MTGKRKVIGFLCSVVFCIAIAAGMPQVAKAAGEVAINETNFPDEIFRNYVKNNFDNDSNNVLSEEEIAGAKGISLDESGITSLTGIEHFTALTELFCGRNQLTALDVSNNTMLTTLYCYDNQLTTLDISKNMVLTHLHCSFNQLTALDISKNTALTSLFCGDNQLTVLDISKNTALAYLGCDNNQLTALDISKNMVLTELYCSNNQLTALDISKNTELTNFWCFGNQLTTLDLSRNTALIELHCDGNCLTALDISKNMVLTKLSCCVNLFTALDLSKNTMLTYLACNNNQLTALDISKNTALTELWCENNQLTNLNTNNNTVLAELWCDNNRLTALDISKNTALTKLCCGSNQLTALDLNKNMTLADLECGYNQLTTLDLSKNTELTNLWCSSDQLAELKLNSQTYDKLSLYKGHLHYYGAVLSSLQNITETATNDDDTLSLLKVIDITKPATYKVNGKDFTIIYADKASMPDISPTATPSPVPTSSPSAPTTTPVVPSDVHIFSDYSYSNPVSGTAVIYGNGINKKVNGIKVSNKELVLYTDILASYKYTLNNSGIVKPVVGKVIVAVTTTNEKPVVEKNKVKDTSASKIARAKIKNGQITVTAVGKDGGLVYLWVIDTGDKGVSACCPVDVKLAPKKLEVQDISGNKLTNTKLQNGMSLDVHVSGISGSVKTEDCTYTATVDSKSQQYASVVPKGTDGKNFTITANGIKDNKNTKVTIIFTCDQNGKKLKFSFTITK